MKIFLLLILVLALAGCSNESEKSKSPASDTFPQDVQFEAVVSMKPLTIEQKNLLKSMLLKMRVIPNSDLILYKPENQDDKSRASRAEQVKKLSPESRAVYDRILAQCQIVQPKEEKSGDQSSNAGAISYTQEASSIYGTQCPLNLQKSSQGSVKVLSSNIDQFKNGTAKVLEIVQESNSESLDKMRVVSDDLQNSSGLVSSDSKESFYFKFKTSAEGNQIYDEFSIKAQAQLTQYGLINPNGADKFSVSSLRFRPGLGLLVF